MSSNWLFLKPSDVWLFRDGRPFSAGENFHASSIFPPTPFTVQGALRSLILGQSTVGWEAFAKQEGSDAQEIGKLIGYPAQLDITDASLGAFSIKGPFVARRSRADEKGQILYPLPLDCYYFENNSSSGWIAQSPYRKGGQKWTSDDDRLYPVDVNRNYSVSDDPPEGRFFLTEDGFESYLENKPFDVLTSREEGRQVPYQPFKSEPRLGIAIDYRYGRAKDQQLYTIDTLRPNDIGNYEHGLLIQLGPNVNLKTTAGYLSLGGESRAAHYEVLSKPPQNLGNPDEIGETKRLKIILQTPAWFEAGWQPNDGNWSAVFGRTGIELKSAVIDKPQHLGGWRVDSSQHKVIRSYVPAGSVFYFEAEAPIEAPKTFTQTPPKELDLQGQGFGAYSATSWEWQ